jgi:type III restriction enzyme
MPSNYGEYLKRDDAHRVHDGLIFPLIKKGKSIDPTVKRAVKNQMISQPTTLL